MPFDLPLKTPHFAPRDALHRTLRNKPRNLPRSTLHNTLHFAPFDLPLNKLRFTPHNKPRNAPHDTALKIVLPKLPAKRLGKPFGR